MHIPPPEEIELQKKHSLLERLKDRLVDREEEMTDLRMELEQFEARYKMEVGRLYAELDEIEAQIAEEEYKLVPDDEEIKKKVEELRRRAEESAARAEAVEGGAELAAVSKEARKVYHQVARTIHPDLALDPAEKEKRHLLMAELNEAYRSHDRSKLNKLFEDVQNSPDLIEGDTVGDALIRTIRQIAQLRSRLTELREQKALALESEVYVLREKIRRESSHGRDALKQMAARTGVHIRKAQRRLENLRIVNKAAEDHVRETYGVDLKSFRQ